MKDSEATTKRYHDLDALRAAAMLLGIVLHGMITFIDLPIAIWPAQDINQSEAYLFLLHVIHGFRLPLFFLISGFFTAMLWRKRGLKALLKQRAKRILLPLVVFLPLIWVALIFVVMPMAEWKTGQPADEMAVMENLNLDFSALPDWAQLVIFGAIIPVFHHLWFLYYLVWLIAGFALVAMLAKKFNWKQLPAKVVASPWRWLWLIPLIMIPQLMTGVLGLYMGVPGFGPDTAGGLIPWPPKLLFYAIVFGYGALCFGHAEFEQVGRRWILCFALAIPALFLGLHWFDLRSEAYGKTLQLGESTVILYHFLTSLCQAAYVWLMTFGFIGLFRRFFSKENKRIRYLSDSSYWLYLAHLPLIMIIQIWVSDWPWPSFMKLIFICALTVIPLLLIYEYVVRYVWVGTMLNGKRTREKVAD
jgi:peptidoglycan/LPS O-acetylase OafA/YrhL